MKATISHYPATGVSQTEGQSGVWVLPQQASTCSSPLYKGPNPRKCSPTDYTDSLALFGGIDDVDKVEVLTFE